MDLSELSSLAESWALHLRATRKAPDTLRAYTSSLSLFLRWCRTEGVEPRLDRDTVNRWVADQLDRGLEASTAALRQKAVKRFSAWLAAEGEIPEDLIASLQRPQVDKKVVPRLTDEECRRLIDACKGRSFRDRRDEAIVRFMLECVVRAGDVIKMQVADLDLQQGLAVIRRSKGGKGRIVPFGPQTGQSIDRYIRMRRGHPLAGTPRLWLGVFGRPFEYPGLYQTLKRRSRDAGLLDFHPHLTRHTGAQRWLSAGGSEGGLMTLAGWKSRAMLDRYTEATAAERAANESRKLNLGDF